MHVDPGSGSGQQAQGHQHQTPLCQLKSAGCGHARTAGGALSGARGAAPGWREGLRGTELHINLYFSVLWDRLRDPVARHGVHQCPVPRQGHSRTDRGLGPDRRQQCPGQEQGALQVAEVTLQTGRAWEGDWASREDVSSEAGGGSHPEPHKGHCTVRVTCSTTAKPEVFPSRELAPRPLAGVDLWGPGTAKGSAPSTGRLHPGGADPPP